MYAELADDETKDVDAGTEDEWGIESAERSGRLGGDTITILVVAVW
jgi:hypothetical protein